MQNKRKGKTKDPALEQLKAQESLESAVSRVVDAIGSSAGAITLWDAERRRSAHSSTYGLSPEDFERIKPMLDHALPDLEEEDDAGRALVLLDQEAANLQVVGKGGPLRMCALPLRSQGRLVGLLCLFNAPEQASDFDLPVGSREVVIDHMDIIYQSAPLLQRLMAEKRWLEGVISSSADAILIVDRDCRIVGFNPAWERLTGWRVDEVRGKLCGEVFETRTAAGLDHCDTACPMKSGAGARPTVSSTEVIMLRRDRSEVPVETSYASIRDDNGEPLGGVISARDISARKEAEALQSTFLSVISHELQTPIAIIRGYAGLLGEQGTKIEPTQLQEKLAVIQEESERLGKMVENLLSASRIQAGRIEMRREPMRLGPLVRRVVQKMRGIGPTRMIATHIPRDLPPVFADYERVHQVLTNLLENALKYSPSGGAIRVTASSSAEEVVVRIRDRGVGVPEAERDRIFQPFSRLDSRMIREVKGAGLGLYICKAIVEAHGGQIWVESPADGGACFAFSLPREDRASQLQGGVFQIE